MGLFTYKTIPIFFVALTLYSNKSNHSTSVFLRKSQVNLLDFPCTKFTGRISIFRWIQWQYVFLFWSYKFLKSWKCSCYCRFTALELCALIQVRDQTKLYISSTIISKLVVYFEMLHNLNLLILVGSKPFIDSILVLGKNQKILSVIDYIP